MIVMCIFGFCDRYNINNHSIKKDTYYGAVLGQ